MTLFKEKYRIESARLEGHDYSSPGEYFVTVCTKGMVCEFGEIVRGQMRLSRIGEIVDDEWQETTRVRANITLDKWIVMPNHLHGILVIGANTVEATRQVVSTRTTKKHTLQRNSLGSVLGQFKSKCTKRIHAAGYPGFSWQPRFYDHIIRDDRQLERIREYIEDNP